MITPSPQLIEFINTNLTPAISNHQMIKCPGAIGFEAGLIVMEFELRNELDAWLEHICNHWNYQNSKIDVLPLRGIWPLRKEDWAYFFSVDCMELSDQYLKKGIDLCSII